MPVILAVWEASHACCHGGTCLEDLLDGCGFMGGGMSLGVGFEVSKAHTKPRVSLSAACESSQLLLQYHTCLFSAVFIMG